MRRALGMMPILLLPIVAGSQWIVGTLEWKVKESDIVVVGKLRKVSEETRDGIVYGSGEITVDEVMWGGAKAGQKLTLVWQNSSGKERRRIEHRDHQGKRGIWLLREESGGEVTAESPGHFVSEEKKDRVLKLLREREKSKSSCKTCR